jgi:hypothetical protein
MHIFWRAPAEFCWRWSFMYSGVTFDLKNAPAAKFMMQSCKFFPPQRQQQRRRMRQQSPQG